MHATAASSGSTSAPSAASSLPSRPIGARARSGNGAAPAAVGGGTAPSCPGRSRRERGSDEHVDTAPLAPRTARPWPWHTRRARADRAGTEEGTWARSSRSSGPGSAGCCRELVRPAIFEGGVPLTVGAYRVPGEPISAAEALSADYAPFAIGGGWGGAWATTWFRFAGEIPADWAGAAVVARLDLGYDGMVGFGGEAQVWHGSTPIEGINPRHREHLVTRAATGGEQVEFHLEAAANPTPPWGGLEWPMLLPDYGGADLYRLNRAELAKVRRDVEAAYDDLRVLVELAESLPATDHRSIEIWRALDEVSARVEIDDVASSLLGARPRWSGLLDSPASGRAHLVSAVGHAHIDTAWLWPIRETVRKCARTFSTAVALMDEYPEYRFVCSQAQQHAWMEERYPSLFAEMRKKVESGQFEPVGSMWVEPDTNVPSGEALCRQLVFGKRFFMDRYGVETEDLWLPDAFGYSGALPQILRQAGVRFFLTQKLSWNEIDRFPHHTFWWEGIDGSRVLAHCPPTDTYNGQFRVGELLNGLRDFAEHGKSRRSLYVYGNGDGGGGPTRAMLESARRLADLDGVPRVTLEPARDFFHAIEDEAAESPGALPTWVGELYLERHRAVLTTQAASKAGNRRCEELLREAECWSVAARADLPYPAGAIDDAWRTVLLHQFHDILPGSSIHWVHADSRRAYDEVRADLEAIIDRARAAIAARVDTSGTAKAVLVWNGATHTREDVVEVDLAAIGLDAVPAAALDPAGNATPVQDLGDGRVAFLATVPGLGWARYDLGGDVEATPLENAAGGDDRHLDNGVVSVTLDDDGVVTSLLHAGREVLAPGARANVLQIHRDLPNDTDAWDVDLGTFDHVTDLTGGVESIEVTERGPVRFAVRVARRFGSSRIVQTLRLPAGAGRLEVVNEVEWHERHRFLKVAFPVDVRASAASFEIQFGHLERPTHTNTTWDEARFEVGAHRWADLSEDGFGVALINDAKYGYDVRGNVLRLSLLRAPGWPDPVADQGEHRFSYALKPHVGTLQHGGVVAAAEAFNLPLVATAVGAHPGPLAPAGTVLAVDEPGVTVSALKAADDGTGVVVRCHEAFGGRRDAGLRLPPEVHGAFARATATDLLERPERPAELEGDTVLVDLRAFELTTVKLEA